MTLSCEGQECPLLPHSRPASCQHPLELCRTTAPVGGRSQPLTAMGEGMLVHSAWAKERLTEGQGASDSTTVQQGTGLSGWGLRKGQTLLPLGLEFRLPQTHCQGGGHGRPATTMLAPGHFHPQQPIANPSEDKSSAGPLLASTPPSEKRLPLELAP